MYRQLTAIIKPQQHVASTAKARVIVIPQIIEELLHNVQWYQGSLSCLIPGQPSLLYPYVLVGHS